MVYKWCAVPQCKNTSVKNPEKMFVTVPTNPLKRIKWLQIAGRDPKSIKSQSNVFMCEDHFDMEKDIVNYTKYKMSFSKKLLLADEAVPTKFDCQDRSCDPEYYSEAFAKRRRTNLLEECEESHSSEYSVISNSERYDNMDQDIIVIGEDLILSTQDKVTMTDLVTVDRSVQVNIRDVQDKLVQTRCQTYRDVLTSPLRISTSTHISTSPMKPQARPMADVSDGSVTPITDAEDEQVVVKMEPEDGQRIVMVQDPQTQISVEGSFKKLHSHAPGDPLYAQPSTSHAPVIKEEIEIDLEDGDYKAMFLKLQQEVEILKADNESLTIENHNLAREIYNLKQTNPNVANAAALADAIKDIQSINKDNELLRELAKENQRLSERICEYADRIQNLTSKYKNDESISRSENVSVGFKKQEDLYDKLRRLTDDYMNIVSERDNLKGQVKNLLEANKELKMNVKLQRKRVEMLRIQCVDNSEKMKRLKNSCFKLRSMYSKLKIARRNF